MKKQLNHHISIPQYAIIDESGRFGDPNSQILVFAGVLTESLIGLDKLIPKLKKKLPNKGKRKREKTYPEIKFNNTGDKTRYTVLKQLNQYPVQIISLIINTEGRKIADTPANYALLLAQLLQLALFQKKLQHLIIDRHFTWVYQQQQLDLQLQRHLEQPIFIEHLDSQQHPIICSADFVAGAIRVAVTKKNTKWKDLINHKIVMEKSTTWRELKTKKSKSLKGSGKTSALLLL